MGRSRNLGGNSSFTSIRYAPSGNGSPDATEDEKIPTPVIDTDALRRICEVVRIIKRRISAGDALHPCSLGDRSGAMPPSSACGKDPKREKAENT